MRASFFLLLLAGFAAGDWEEAQRRFREAYRDGAPAAQRREALLELARADVPEAADHLLDVWERLEGECARLRRDLFKVRAALRRTESREERKPLEARDVELSGRLGALELERAAIVQGIRGLAAPATVAWLGERGIGRARSPALLRACAERVVAAGDGGAAVLFDALEKARDAGQAVALLDALAAHGGRIGLPGLPVVLRRLSHWDPAVRAAAARAVARAALPEGIAALVRQVQREAPRSRCASSPARRRATIPPRGRRGGATTRRR